MLKLHYFEYNLCDPHKLMMMTDWDNKLDKLYQQTDSKKKEFRSTSKRLLLQSAPKTTRISEIYPTREELAKKHPVMIPFMTWLIND